jgi:hypothetical protein
MALKLVSKDLTKKIQDARARFEQVMILELDRLGLQCVSMSKQALGINSAAFPITTDKAQAKPLKQRILTESEAVEGQKTPVFGDYLDQTGNLRSSIGYFIAKDGVIIKGQGTSESRSFASSIIRQYNSGFSLIVVAGMEYAVYVEAKGYNVISSSELFAIAELPNVRKRMQALFK